MSRIKKGIDFYINSSIHVGLAVVSLSLVTALNQEISVSLALIFFILFGTITAYNFVKYAGVAKLHHRSLTKRLRSIQILSIASLLFFLGTTFYVSWLVLVWSGFFGVLTILYALPFLGNKRNLRSVSGLKIFIIALVWAGVTVFLPVLEEGLLFDLDILLSFLQRFLFVLVLILPFEIRDLKYDLLQLRTIPQRMGITRTKILGFFLLGLIVLVEFLKEGISGPSLAALIIVVLVTATLVWRSKEKQSFYYSAFWVEAVPILWLFLLVFFAVV